ncbi:MAG: hypothetical protein Q7K55_03410 [Candidatus Levybacteria bacterium]|nr:hypothetical protein [Candidatus Levybacteria bacterium]
MKEGQIIYQENKSSGRMEISCRGFIGMEGICNYLETLDIDLNLRNEHYDILDQAKKIFRNIFQFGGAITTSGEYIVGINKVKLDPFDYTQMTNDGYVEKNMHQITREWGNETKEQRPNVKIYYLSERLSERLACEVSDRGAIISLILQTDKDPRVFPGGLEASLIALVKNLHHKKSIDPIIAPKSIFKQIMLDMIQGKNSKIASS